MNRGPTVPMLVAALVCLAPIVGSTAGSSDAEPTLLVERTAYLMGTSARLAVYAPDRPTGLARLARALDALEATDRDLSTWKTDSAISAFNRTPPGVRWQAGALCGMLTSVRAWQRSTGGAFDPAIGALVDAWGLHEGGRVPSPAALTAARARSGFHLVDFDVDACVLTRRTQVTLDVGGFGKGEALDRAAAALTGERFLIDLGGQVSVGGLGPDEWTVDVAHPTIRTRPALSVRLRSGSLATSGGSERDVVADGRRVGHILDPRSGTPAGFTGSVTVWHERGLVADILSTALYVMGPVDGAPWAESHGVSAAFLMPESQQVRVVATTAFAALLPRDAVTAPE